MELCSASLSGRYRQERLPVDEVLRIAIKIGSAIETAHRAGVLHRDIKPSNILLTAYGHPVLSDFGIASTLSGSALHG
jgi:serine/threonine protein kinase